MDTDPLDIIAQASTIADDRWQYWRNQDFIEFVKALDHDDSPACQVILARTFHDPILAAMIDEYQRQCEEQDV